NLVTLNNAGTILATGATGLAVTGSGTINIVSNSGTITSTGTTGTAIAGNTGTVNITANSGTISAVGLNGIAISGGAVTVSNAHTNTAGLHGISETKVHVRGNYILIKVICDPIAYLYSNLC